MSSYKNRHHKLYYNIYNSRNNINNLLLIHDNGQSSKIFDSEIKFYSSYFNTITVDLAGHGKSAESTDSENNFWVSNAIAISEICAKEKFTKVSIIGMGMGAVIGINMAMHAPTMVKSILAESMPGIEPDHGYIQSLLRYRESLTDSDNKSLFQSWNGSKWEKVLDSSISIIEDLADNGSLFLNGDPSTVNCPILFAGSSGYDLLPDMEERLKENMGLFRRSQVHLFSNAKYPLIISKNDEYRTVALNYLMD